MTILELLQARDGDIWAVSPQATVYDALRMLADKDVGALLVIENDKLVGVFSERDYARKIVLHGKSSAETFVWEIMSQGVVTISPQSTIDECMTLMTDKRVRHLPVMVGDKVVGIVSIGDIVKAIITKQAHTIENLEQYIMGEGYGQ